MYDFAQPKLSFPLVENFDAYLHAKNKLRNSLLSWNITFSRTLQFNWLKAFWSITREPEFCEIWVWCWSMNNNTSFHFRLFSEKTNDKIFQKIKKSPSLGTFWALFAKTWTKMRSVNSVSFGFSIFQLSTTMQKKSGKTNDPFPRKMLKWQTGRQTGRQQSF